MELFKTSLATLTGGSGAAAVVLTDGSYGAGGHRLLGGVTQAAPEHHQLCRWGVQLGLRTWEAFLAALGWRPAQVDKVICHQIGAGHRDAILPALGIAVEKDFCTYEYLGNIGTVSLPMTAAIADERDFLRPGDRVGFLGIGSGLNCLMLGLEW
jgi:3-oxoacyl-[acyl-carrier-protein] synthase-3